MTLTHILIDCMLKRSGHKHSPEMEYTVTVMTSLTLTIDLKQSGKEGRGQKSVSDGIIKKSTLSQSHSWSEFKLPCPLVHSCLAQK